ncbi:MAG: hypothetical protein WBC70_10900 [Candidatus Aminicenantales bacterium]
MIRKAVRLVLKCIGIFVAAAALLMFAYVLFNTHWGKKYRQVTEAELRRYEDYLDAHVSDPLAFVARKFEDYDVVLLGEIHHRKQDVEFIKALIPYLYKRSGVDIIGWEFGASDLQNEVDALVDAPEFDERKAIWILRTSKVYWNCQEYLEVFRVIWRLNRDLTPGRGRVRFLQLDYVRNERKQYSPDPKVRKEEKKRLLDRDRHMADIMDKEVLQKGKKALWYSGLHHAFTKYRQPRFFFRHRTGNKRRAGNFLFDRYPGRVGTVALHAPAMSRLSILSDLFPSLFSIKFYFPFGSVIDKVYAGRKQPFAFDTGGSPFGELKDNYSYYSVDHWGGLKLKDFCDGYVVPCSFAESEAVSSIPDWIPSEDVYEEVKATQLSPATASKFKTRTDFLKHLENVASESIRSIHNVLKKE